MVARNDPPTPDGDRDIVITRRDIHNLKNCVAVIKGYTQLLQRQLTSSGDERLIRRIAALDAEVERLEDVVAAWSSPRVEAPDSD